MFFKFSSIAASVLALSSFANAAIVYSNVSLDVLQDDVIPVSISIADKTFEVGFVQGYNFAYVTTTSVGAGIFIPLSQAANPVDARSFAQGDTIGTSTSLLKMYPLGVGGENINLELYNFGTQSGTFPLGTAAYVGFGLGSGTQFNYGWIKLAVSADAQYITIYGWAYNDVVNQSITVGQIPAPGAFALLAMGGLVARRRRLS